MDAERKAKLAKLIEMEGGNRVDFCKLHQVTYGTVSYFLAPDVRFGNLAARNLAKKLDLPSDYFNDPNNLSTTPKFAREKQLNAQFQTELHQPTSPIETLAGLLAPMLPRYLEHLEQKHPGTLADAFGWVLQERGKM